MRTIKKRLIVWAAVIFTLSSCGYRFTPLGGVVPEGAKTISIPIFVNNTNEPYVDVEVTKAVVQEFLSDGRLKIVSSETADLLLKGTVTKFEISPLSYTTDSYVQQYSVNVALQVSLEDVKTHKIVWQESGLGSVFVTSYAVTIGDITSTKTAKEAALKKAAKDVASTLRSRVLEGF